jgi:hypothetical protein
VRPETTVQIDLDRVAGIIEKYRGVEPLAAYSLMRGCRYQVLGIEVLLDVVDEETRNLE